MEKCIEGLFEGNKTISGIVNYIVGFLPIILSVIAAILIYKGTMKFAKKRLGYTKIQATYVIEETKKGFSFVYNGKSYFVENVYTGVNEMKNGQSYPVYIKTENPEILFLYNNEMGVWHIMAMVFAILSFCAITTIFLELPKMIC